MNASRCEWSEGGRRKKREAWARLMLTEHWQGWRVFLLCNWVFKSKCANLKERVKWSQEVIVFMVIKASRIGEMKQRMKRSTLAINKQCFTVWSSETDEHGNNLWFENEMKHCKKRDSPISPSDPQASKKFSGGCPLKKTVWTKRIPYWGSRGQE
jgi:hypothetical protein